MLWAAPVIGAAIALVSYSAGLSGPASWCAWVAIVCALWWIFECLHIAVVGLVPFIAFPITGIVNHKTISSSYGHTMILLLMGGFFLSAAMERSGAHRRIALAMVRAVGGNGGKRLVLGFMLATASLSMWISNAATTLMMVPIAAAVLAHARDPKLETPLYLGMAYAASVGGMATPIGTPPNLIFMSVMEEMFDTQVSFARWMSFGIPIVIVLLPTIWWWVTRSIKNAKAIEMPESGQWRPSEKRVLMIFGCAAFLWVFRSGPWGGWSSFFPDGSAIGDSTVALAASLALFVCPAGEPLSHTDQADTQPGTVTDRLLDWDAAKKIPWGILVMFGGGLALAQGFQQSGLSESLGQQLAFLGQAPTWVVVLSVCLLVTFLTEITSSTATATLLMPILGALAIQTKMQPESIMIPGTISASCAFMLPVATAPNVIVFGTGKIRTETMARTGLFLNFVAAGVITTVALWMT